MMYENIDDNGRTVKCRKEHKCQWCSETISIGETAVRRVYKMFGRFVSAYVHPNCYSKITIPATPFEMFEKKEGEFGLLGKTLLAIILIAWITLMAIGIYYFAASKM